MTRSRLTALLTAALVLLTALVGAVAPAASAASAASASPVSTGPAAVATPSAATTAAPPVIMVGTGGLTWSDVSPDGDARAVVAAAGRRLGLADRAIGAQQHLPGRRVADPVGRRTGR